MTPDLVIRALAAGLALLPATALASRNGLETPIAHSEVRVPAKPGSNQDDATWTCETYSAWTVKWVTYGGKGDETTWVSPAPAGAAPPPCRPGPQPGERKVNEGNILLGAAGDFLVLTGADGFSNAIPVLILRASDGKSLYTDAAKLTLSDIALDAHRDGDTLTLSFTRVVLGKCNIAAGGPACWTQFARDTHLPRDLAARPAPIDTCRAAMPKPPWPQDVAQDPSALAYPVHMTITLAGKTEVQSRGDFTCWLQD